MRCDRESATEGNVFVAPRRPLDSACVKINQKTAAHPHVKILLLTLLEEEKKIRSTQIYEKIMETTRHESKRIHVVSSDRKIEHGMFKRL